ncbi:hypothetical protein M427DRAFT_155187, partial [Gonapodya prolifera JEL478]
MGRKRSPKILIGFAADKRKSSIVRRSDGGGGSGKLRYLGMEGVGVLGRNPRANGGIAMRGTVGGRDRSKLPPLKRSTTDVITAGGAQSSFESPSSHRRQRSNQPYIPPRSEPSIFDDIYHTGQPKGVGEEEAPRIILPSLAHKKILTVVAPGNNGAMGRVQENLNGSHPRTVNAGGTALDHRISNKEKLPAVPG